MKHLKLFDDLNIDEDEFPENEHELNQREKQILVDLVGKDFLKRFKIRKEDNYYYTSNVNYYNKLDGFNELKNYLLCSYYIENNKPNDVLRLLQSTDLDPSFDYNELIIWASRNGHIEVIKLLLKDPRVDPSVDDNYVIGYASERGHTEVVKLLLDDPRVDPSDMDNYAVRHASENGHVEVVKLLLQDARVDPSDDDNEAIIWASRNGHTEIVKLLIQDPRVRAKLTPKEIKEYETY